MADKQHNIRIRITTDASGALDVTKRIGQNLKTFGDLWSQAGRAAVIAATAANGAILGLALSGAKAAEEIGATAKRLGSATEEIQAIAFAARQSETEMGAVTTAMRALSVQAFQAATKGGEAGDAFKRLRIDVREANGDIKTATQLFKETIDRLSGVENSTSRVALAQDLLGRSAIQLGSFIRAGSDAISNASDTIKALGAEVDGATAALGDRMGDAINITKLSVQGLSFALVRALGPAVIDTALKLAAMVAQVTKWADENRDLVVSIAEVTVKTLLVATAFFAFAKAAASLGSLLSGLATFLRGPFALAFLAVAGVMTALVLVFNLLFDSFRSFVEWVHRVGDVLSRLGTIMSRGPLGRFNFMANGIYTAGEALKYLANQGIKADDAWKEVNARFAELKRLLEGLDTSKVEEIVPDTGTDKVDKAAEAVRNLQAALASDAANEFHETLKNIFDLGGKIDFDQVRESLREVQGALDRGDPNAAVDAFQRAQAAAIKLATEGAAQRAIDEIRAAQEATLKLVAEKADPGTAVTALFAGMRETDALIAEGIAGAHSLQQAQAAVAAMIMTAAAPTEIIEALKQLQEQLTTIPVQKIRPEDLRPAATLSEEEAGPPAELGADEIERRAKARLERMSLLHRGINNEVEKTATRMLEELGSVAAQTGELLVHSFMDLGNVVGAFVENLILGTSELNKLSTEHRIAELHAELAGTAEEQARWTAEAERTEETMNRLELAALENRTAWTAFWQSMREWAAKLLADIAALIAKMAILKALSNIGPFGDLFSFFGLKFKEGGVVPRFAGGGFVHGGVWGRDSVPALLAPGELVVPAEKTGAFLSQFGDVRPNIININAGLLAGDKGTAREIVRLIDQELEFLHSGKTV